MVDNRRDGVGTCTFSYHFGEHALFSALDDHVGVRGRLAMQAMREQLDCKEIPPTTLDFACNILSSSPGNADNDNGRGVRALFQALEGHTAVTTLDLQQCRLGPQSAMAIATHLQRGVMPNLSTLVLSANAIGSKGVSALAELIMSGKVRGRPLHRMPHIYTDTQICQCAYTVLYCILHYFSSSLFWSRRFHILCLATACMWRRPQPPIPSPSFIPPNNILITLLI